MNHCVASYSSKCQSGDCRIFSVSKGGGRACTLELSTCDSFGDLLQVLDFSDLFKHAQVKSWRNVQNRGKHNKSIVEEDLTAFCSSIEKLVQANFEADTVLIAEARVKEKLSKKEMATALIGERGYSLEAKCQN